MTNDLFTRVASICAKKYELIFSRMPEIPKDKKAKRASLIQGVVANYDIVLPYPPTIYQMRNAYKDKCIKEEKSEFLKDSKQKKEAKKESFDVEKEICQARENPSFEELSKVYRLMGFKILNIFAMIILKNTHPAQKVERIVERVKFFINFIIFYYLQILFLKKDTCLHGHYLPHYGKPY